MGNLFCSEYRIHRRFDLKGSSYGRTTDKPEGEIDETTTLKDLDLNFVFRLQQNWFQELIKLVLYALFDLSVHDFLSTLYSFAFSSIAHIPLYSFQTN